MSCVLRQRVLESLRIVAEEFKTLNADSRNRGRFPDKPSSLHLHYRIALHCLECLEALVDSGIYESSYPRYFKSTLAWSSFLDASFNPEEWVKRLEGVLAQEEQKREAQRQTSHSALAELKRTPYPSGSRKAHFTKEKNRVLAAQLQGNASYQDTLLLGIAQFELGEFKAARTSLAPYIGKCSSFASRTSYSAEANRVWAKLLVMENPDRDRMGEYRNYFGNAETLYRDKDPYSEACVTRENSLALTFRLLKDNVAPNEKIVSTFLMIAACYLEAAEKQQADYPIYAELNKDLARFALELASSLEEGHLVLAQCPGYQELVDHLGLSNPDYERIAATLHRDGRYLVVGGKRTVGLDHPFRGIVEDCQERSGPAP